MKYVALYLLLGISPSLPAEETISFEQCTILLREQAGAAGITAATLEQVFAGLQPAPSVIRRDRRQLEFVASFWDYLDRTVTRRRVKHGRDLRQQHVGLLARIQEHFGVRAEHILALWGMETNYGKVLGNNSVLQALATLACDKRRPELFRSEFMSALTIIDRGLIDPLRLQGSWAGAMGQVQFLPSVYLQHAQDFDGDNKRDIYDSLPDALASAANYLRAIGWQPDERWGREVILPRDFEWSLAQPEVRLAVSEWSTKGIKTAFGEPLPQADIPARLILPAGRFGPAFLTYPNFAVTMEWNRSSSYALSVGILADRIAGSAGLVTPKPRGFTRLRRKQVVEIQELLNALGFDSGVADGVAGTQTRNAVRAFQLANQLPADGHPNQTLLKNLRKQHRVAN